MVDGNKEVHWFGTSGSLVEQSTPILMDMTKIMPDLFGEGKLNSSNVLGGHH